MKPLIKICGISDAKLAQDALKTGANLVGIVLTPTSKRCVKLKKAIEMTKAIAEMNAKPVLVFKDEPIEIIEKLAHQIGNCILQFQGENRSDLDMLTEKFETIISFSYEVIPHLNQKFCQKFKMGKSLLLIDGKEPGSGKKFDWGSFRAPSFPWILAGGLNEDNVRASITQCHPFGVDVSSGVEDKNGKKDLNKIIRFIKTVRQQ